MLEERDRLLRAAAPTRDQPLGVEGLGEDLRQPERLGHFDRDVVPARSDFNLALEEVEPPELGSERREVAVRLVTGKHLEGALHSVERLLEVPGAPLDLAETRRDTRRRMRRRLRLVELERAREMRTGLLGPPRIPRARTGPVAERGRCERLDAKLLRPHEVV